MLYRLWLKYNLNCGNKVVELHIKAPVLYHSKEKAEKEAHIYKCVVKKNSVSDVFFSLYSTDRVIDSIRYTELSKYKMYTTDTVTGEKSPFIKGFDCLHNNYISNQNYTSINDDFISENGYYVVVDDDYT